MSKNPVKGKYFILSVAVAVLSFAAVGAFLSTEALNEIREIVASQFNEQQLIVAQNAKSLIERELDLVKKEILFIKRKAFEWPPENEEDLDYLRNSLARIMESGVQRVELLDLDAGIVQLYTAYGQNFITRPLEAEAYREIVFSDMETDEVWVSSPHSAQGGMTMALGARLENGSNRYLLAYINTTWFLKPFLKNVRSGATGYAWIIDQQGIFLFHQDTTFIGQNAFEARKERNPDLSFEEINFIQKEKMLKGEEGVGYYHSGWHRGLTGQVKKLIAYTPVFISGHPHQNWSVAVVAPVYEIEDKVKQTFVWQMIFQGFSFAGILFAALVVLWFERRWSRSLEIQVDRRTDELKRSEEKYRLLLESAEDYIFTVDEDHCLQSLNSFTAKFFGGAPDELVGTALNGIFPSEIADEQVRNVGLVFQHGKSVRDEYLWRVGEYEVWINANYMPLKDKDGKVRSVLCIARDITENKKLERSLVNTEKLASLGTLAAGVAHEINNPLGVILGFCDILLRKFEPSTQNYDDLKVIERQGEHCKQIVENLLSFARAEDGNFEYCDINVCLREILMVVRHNLEMHRIRLVEAYSEGLPPVRGDHRRLQQVFLNLFNNATAAMKGGGTLKVRTYAERPSHRLVVEIQDDGEGIKAKDISHVFEPFYTTKPPGEGTGLGLFVSYGIIKNYGGTIECVSNPSSNPARQRGTTFIIKLHMYEQE